MKLQTKSKKGQGGITLIALVITIIVLLILAGVSIALLTGENGILTKATQANNLTNQECAREKLALILNDLQSDKILKGEKLTLSDTLASEIQAYKEVTSATFKANLIEVVIDGYTFDVNGNLGIDIKKELEKVEPTNLSDWTYKIEDDGTATITGYKGTDTILVVPNYIEGHWVKKIDPYFTSPTSTLWDKSICEFIDRYNSFSYNVQRTITDIIISDGIEVIGIRAFGAAEKVQSIKIPRSVTQIDSYAFALENYGKFSTGKIDNPLKVLNLPNTLKTVDAYIFNGREDITVNVEYAESEIPTTWNNDWNYNRVQYFFNAYLEFKTTINYGVPIN